MGETVEVRRQLVEMAIACGRKRQSRQTGFVHHCYQPQDDEPHLTIPIIENFLFALALLRSRTIENINEAKALLEKLLAFQNKDSREVFHGNFPIYIHDYPACKDRFIAADVALSICSILKHYHQVLGGKLKEGLENALLLMLAHCERSVEVKPAPFPVALKIAAVLTSAGIILKRSELQEKGERLLNELAAAKENETWYCPQSIGEILSALKLIYSNLKDSPWVLFWNYLRETWHTKTGCYIGPSNREWQHGNEPEVTLYDLYLGFFSKSFSERAKQDTIVHLEAALILSCEEDFEPISLPHAFKRGCENEAWSIYQDEEMAYCCIVEKPDVNPLHLKGFHPFRMIWGDKKRVHTLVFQGSAAKNFTFSQVQRGIDATFVLSDVPETGDPEKNREIVFYIDKHQDLQMSVSDHKVTTFSIGEPITLISGSFQLSLTFQLENGEGRFMGHRMLGNRLSQQCIKGKQRHDAYDWQLFLRSVKRSGDCVIKVFLRMDYPLPLNQIEMI